MEIEWKKSKGRRVFRNLAQRWDVFPFGGRQLEGNDSLRSASIYFSEISERVNSRVIFGLLGCIGEIVEVVIPPKRNKLQKRFGFARFKEVEDVRMMAVKLDNVVIDKAKIHANPPRFERTFKGGFEKGKELGKPREQVPHQRHQGKGLDSLVGLRTFADVTTERKKEHGVEVPKVTLDFAFDSKDLDCLSKAYVGKVVISGMSYNIQTCLKMEEYFSIRVTPLGGNSCLLEEVEEGDIRDLIREGRCGGSTGFQRFENGKRRM